MAALPAPALAQADGPVVDLQASFVSDAALASGPPVVFALPTVAGSPIEGRVLTAASGSWSPSATSVAYQWQRDDGDGFADISGATGTTYVLLGADVDASFRVHVVATNAHGSAQADSAAVGPVIEGQPVNTATPVITGSLQGGKPLTVTAGTWYPTATSYAYRWQRNTSSGFVDIAGATNPTYFTVAADVTVTVRARVTATNAYGSVTATAAGVGPITSGVPVNSVVPIISGTVKRGSPLAVNSGTWSPSGSFSFRWQRDEGDGFADVTGATGTSYTPTVDDRGFPLQVVVTATNAFGSAHVATAATGDVVTDLPRNVGAPGIAGTAKRTLTLTASAGTWTPAGATFAYQWQRDDGDGFTDISGATAASYVLATADVDTTIRVEVTATNVDGSTTVASAPTTTVVAATPGSRVAPAMTGGSRVGDTLTSTDGAWSPAAESFAYRWQRRVGGGTWTDIAGATTNTYILVAADAGATVRVKVTATNDDGTGVGYSAATATVVAPPTPSSTIDAPTGTRQDTETLSIDPGQWTPANATFTYQWLRCPSGATAPGGCVTVGSGQNYILSGNDVGHAMAVRVTATAAGVSTMAMSTFTSDVAGRALTLTSAPTIQGTVQVAQTIRALPAVWTVPTRSEKYQWRRCDTDGTNCVDIPGAGGQTYKVAVADKDHALVVHETATSPGRSASVDSAASTVADQTPPAASILPTVSGVAIRAANLQATRGSWANDPTAFAYAWLRCDDAGDHCAAIPGATRTNYVLQAADVGSTVTVTVTATNTEGATVAAAAPTAVVAAVLPQVATVGPIIGTLQVPKTLQVIRPTWHTTIDTRYGYQWQRCDTTGVTCVDIAGARSLSYRLQTADARARLRVVTVATNVDGSTTVATAPTAAIRPALPGVQVTPRLTVQGRAEVGKTLTLTPATWNASTEIDTKVLQFWRCNPGCNALSTDGAGAYVLDDADAGAMMRGSETATGPGGSTVAWAATWLGPVRSASAGFASMSARSSAVVRTSRGVALAQASVGPAVVGAVASATKVVATPRRDRIVRVSLRRAHHAPAGKLRAWVCLATPSALETTPCSKAVALGTRATLKLAIAKGRHLRVVIVRARHR
ncbi:MAG TPA: hypothetical protein VFY45_25090 [Baekduia sp.]|nr:hypothetical protein [Baekduia sp.]